MDPEHVHLPQTYAPWIAEEYTLVELTGGYARHRKNTIYFTPWYTPYRASDLTSAHMMVINMEGSDGEPDGWLKREFESFVLEWPGVTEQTMLGNPAYAVDGSVFAVVANTGLVLTSLPEHETESLREAFDTGLFHPGNGEVKDWTLVELDNSSELNDLHSFIASSYETARK